MSVSTQAVDNKVTKSPVRAKVVSVSKDGTTAKVEIPTIVAHKQYGKRFHRISTLQVDTAQKKFGVGVEVSILPCRRLSKTKSWKVIEILK